MNRNLLVRNLSCLVTCDDEDRILKNVDVLVKGGRIHSVTRPDPEKKREAAAEELPVIDGRDFVMYPGLVNTHHHLYQIFSRNLPQVQNMELFPWLRTLYQIWKNLDSEVVYHSSLTGMAELLKTGCTTAADHHYVFPEGCDLELLEAQFEAAEVLGMRFHATRGSMDLSEKDGGLPPDSVVQPIDRIMKSSRDAAERFHDASEFSMRQVALAPCSPFSVSKDLLRESAVLARALGVRLHTHLAETLDEERYMLEKEGKRPLRFMEELGWVGKDVWYAHGIHFNDEELKLLAETGTGVAHCPVSNMKLSSGIARIPEMLRLSVPAGLAVDGSASNDGSNLLEEIRCAYLMHRLHESEKAPSGYEILKLATRGSARLLGREKLGKIAEGCAADFFMINMNRPELVGAQFDPGAMLATVGFKGSVDYTVVNGRIVVEHGRLKDMDEAALAREANRVCERYLEKAGI